MMNDANPEIDRQLALAALEKNRRGEMPNSRERAALKRVEKVSEPIHFGEERVYEPIPHRRHLGGPIGYVRSTAAPVEEVLTELAADVPREDWDKLPSDLTDNLDHYLDGTPKRSGGGARPRRQSSIINHQSSILLKLAGLALMLAVWLLVMGLLASWFAPAADGQTWQWSPPAEYHRAVVRVRSGDRGTTGAVVDYRGLRGVLTVAHGIVGAQATVTFSDGTQKTGNVTIDKYKHDLAWVFVDHAGIDPLAVAAADPRPGDRVEFVTYGGPGDRLRHFFGRVGQVGPRETDYQTYVTSGDSGGPIVNRAGEVLGVQATADRLVTPPGTWPVYRGAHAVSCAPLRSFLARIVGCRPGACPLPPRVPAGGVELYPPIDIAERPKIEPEEGPVMPPQTVPPIPEGAVELTRRMVALEEKLDLLTKLIESREPVAGPPGPGGPPGPRGPPGAVLPAASGATWSVDALTAEQLAGLAAALPPIRVEVLVLDDAGDGRPPLNEPIYNEAGKRVGTLVDRDDVHLGGVLPLTLISVPRKSP